MRRSLALPSLLVLACTANTTPTPATTAVADAPAAEAKAPATPPTPAPLEPPSPADPATPTPAPAPATTDPAPPADGPPPPAAPSDATFQLAAYRDGDLALRRVGDAVFVVGGAGLAHEDARGKLGMVEYGLSGLSDPEEWGTWNPLAFGGAWPENAWLTTQFEYSRGSSRPQVHRREGALWRRVDNKDGVLYWYHDPIVTWREGQVLGVRRYIADPNLVTEEAGEPTPRRVQRKVDAQLAAARRGLDLLGPKPAPAAMVVDPGMHVLRLAVAPTGELFALGRGAADDGGKDFRVQRWGLEGEAAIAGTVHPLDTAVTCAQIAVRAADEVYAGCTRRRGERAYLARFDGAAWTEEPAPAARGLVDLAVAPGGELWAIAGDSYVGDREFAEVWRRPARGAAWERVALPELRYADRAHSEILFSPTSDYRRQPADPEAAAKAWPVDPKELVVRADGDVWIRGETHHERDEVSEFMVYRHVVLRNREVREPLRMLHDLDLRADLLDWRSARAWKPGHDCDNGLPAFVALRTLPRDTPKNQDEPAVEALVTGHAALMDRVHGIYEFWRRGRRTIGLLVRPAQQADADAILAALAQVAPGEQRTLECRWPRARREFDKTTGKPIDAPPT